MTDKLREVCERLDWTVHEYDNGDVDLEKYSPAGEDFIFSVELEDFVENVKKYAADFDQDEHIELWIDSRGKNGVPSRVRELVEDAEAIDKMLQELATALQEAEDSAEKEDNNGEQCH